MSTVAKMKERTAWADHAAASLTEAGYRRGGARRAILDLLGGQGCALSAQEIEDRLKGSERVVGRATVYRVLEELEGLRLVGRVEVGDGVARYEPLHPDHSHHHHHLVCDVCGELVPFEDDELEQAIGQIARRVDFDVSGHDVTLRGVCAACRARS